MNQQEIFDRVWDHFIVGGKPPGFMRHPDASWRSACMYRTEEGNPCAAGVVLTDGQVELIKAEGLIDFIGKLQMYHDRIAMDKNIPDADFTARYQESLTDLATRFNLTIPVAS